MKSADELFVMGVFALIGGVAGFLVFVMGLGGWEYVFIGKSSNVLLGGLGLALCVGIGGVGGWYAYRHRHHDVGGVEPFAHDAAGGFLLTKRLMVVVGGLIAVYYVWQVLGGMR